MSTATLAYPCGAALQMFPVSILKGSPKTPASDTLDRVDSGQRKSAHRHCTAFLGQTVDETPETDAGADRQSPANDPQSRRAPFTAQRDQLILEHLPLVKAVAIRVFQGLPLHVDLEDLVHAGILGLLDAADKYDDTRHIPFRAYAKYRIKGAILDSLRELDWASRDLRRRHKQLEEATRELTAATGRPPTEVELAAKMGMSLERWREVAIDLHIVGLISASSRYTDNEDTRLPDFPAASDSNPDVMTVQSQLESALDTAMASLPERHRQVIRNYYTDGKTMREIGESMGINESRVSQLHKAALTRMAEKLESSGIRSAECVL